MAAGDLGSDQAGDGIEQMVVAQEVQHDRCPHAIDIHPLADLRSAVVSFSLTAVATGDFVGASTATRRMSSIEGFLHLSPKTNPRDLI